MPKVSVIIPARNEMHLQRTIDDLLAKATGEIEVIAVLDGYWPDPPIKDDPRVILIHRSESQGMRAAINSAARIATGKYLMKSDAHCCFSHGFDETLKADCSPDWTIIPERYDLDVETWDRIGDPCAFQYMRNPVGSKNPLRGNPWPEYAERVKGQQIFPIMVSQGSCWFMERERFWALGGLDEENYGTIGREATEIACKSWLSGGSYMMTRHAWYAHRPVKEPTYPRPHDQVKKSIRFSTDLWLNNKWPGQTRPFSWLLEKFSPIPTWHDQYISLPTEVRKENPTLMKGLDRAGLYEQFHQQGFKIGAEIGVWDGINARLITGAMPGAKLFLVDPYQDYPGSQIQRGKERFEKAWDRAHRYTRGRNVQFIKHDSFTSHLFFRENSLDFVYIDGNHTYDFVMMDILLWLPKVKPGGVIAGHDYYFDPKHNVGVKKAVDDYARAHDIQFFITDKMAERNGRKAMATWFWVKR